MVLRVLLLMASTSAVSGIPNPNPGKEGRQRASSASEAPQFSRGKLIGHGCCRTMGGGPGGLRAWDEQPTAEG